jgi:hypothetical protein
MMPIDETVEPIEYRIELDIEGATEADLARGVAEAIAVFQESGIDPWDGAHAHHDWEWGAENGTPPTQAEVNANSVYVDAIDAALAAACYNLPNTPKKYAFCLYKADEKSSGPNPFALDVVYPTTEYGRPMDQIQATPASKRRVLVGWNWEWALPQ